ncbi:hypothetical protein PCO85_03475 [Prodigiosinella aquatilis]|nr:hypothetical protein [Prodigiosinella sp. LS101]WJV54528.1 hypothetical protein PCO85_03475 [Prodigiosinella sp. LS101]WJV58890.1 hypothetical protein PCO84_03485 [Pectobacteriaceae bacterium C111]
MSNIIKKKIKLGQLDAGLRCFGHKRLWLCKTRDQNGQTLYVIITYDEREVAWWNDEEETWIITMEASVIMTNPKKSTPNNYQDELNKESIFTYSVKGM